MRLYGTQSIINNHLHIGGVSTKDLARTYGTPLYIMDEEEMRSRTRLFRENFIHERIETEVIYASKAFMTKAMAKLIKEENLSLDVVSGGELFTALAAGFPAEKIFFHGNNKSLEELVYAVHSGVGTIILDNEDEAERLRGILEEREKKQRVILRVNPGIEAHTHEYISTTKNDSKFGLSIFSADTVDLIKTLDADPVFDFRGIHCHIGSQIFEEESYFKAVEEMLGYVGNLKEKGIAIRELNLGGGFGVSYEEKDTPMVYENFLKALLEHVAGISEQMDLLPLKVLIEPGRAIVANAGTTLYEVGGTKTTYGGKKYVFVDGSMADHIRTVLYDATYTACLADRMEDPQEEVYTVTGKACESGDILVREAHLPVPEKGNLLAVFSTGAYHYSMASNYNRLRKPPVIFVRSGKSKVVVKRETYEDLIRNDQMEEY
ncbi:diaminopimelate decarboxylase [Proteiniclasticum sp. C24MP]|uniref:diaminopimelate decarboxylase n=1 Tax=Proteiniclasticum sp. C24MP TaxID=3374101 RepID=UPI0037550AD4